MSSHPVLQPNILFYFLDTIYSESEKSGDANKVT